ncbi:MAG: hypothetical protein PHH13_01570 [Candidatus Peribacteraceae bacterium]|nr:hypothetical protein [Candidatus Peribacteraceae bacterium]
MSPVDSRNRLGRGPDDSLESTVIQLDQECGHIAPATVHEFAEFPLITQRTVCHTIAPPRQLEPYIVVVETTPTVFPMYIDHRKGW